MSGARAGTHQITVMDGTGDTVTVYDPIDTQQLAAAAAQFDQLMHGGRYKAFVTEQEGGTSEPTTTFRPDAYEHIFFTQPQGG